MAAEWELRDVHKRIAFGTRQKRKIFPVHQAPDRLGIQLKIIRGNPSLGPGSYKIQERSSLTYLLGNKPLSKKGYVIGARTAQRFRPEPQTVTPGPAMYQSFWGKERKCQPAYAPFSSKIPRFPDKLTDKELFPGPGTFEVDKQLHKKVTWPMKFGSPDWSLVSKPAKSKIHPFLLKVEVPKPNTEREARKQRDRVAYLGLYYS